MQALARNGRRGEALRLETRETWRWVWIAVAVLIVMFAIVLARKKAPHKYRTTTLCCTFASPALSRFRHSLYKGDLGQMATPRPDRQAFASRSVLRAC